MRRVRAASAVLAVALTASCGGPSGVRRPASGDGTGVRNQRDPGAFLVLQRRADGIRQEAARRLGLTDATVVRPDDTEAFLDEGLSLCHSRAEETTFLMSNWTAQPPYESGEGARHAWESLVGGANRRLLQRGPGGIAWMCLALELATGDPVVQGNTRLVVLGFGREAVPALLAQLRSGYDHLSEFEILQPDRDNEIRPRHTVRAATVPERRLRRAVVRAEIVYYLGKIAAGTGWDEIVRLIEEDPQPIVRMAAIESCARWADQRAVDALGAFLSSDEPVERRFALDLLIHAFGPETDVNADAARWSLRLDADYEKIQRPVRLLLECIERPETSEAARICALRTLASAAGRPPRGDARAWRRHFDGIDREVGTALLRALDDRASEVSSLAASRLQTLTGDVYNEEDARDPRLWLDRFRLSRIPEHVGNPWGP
ncbi:MAG: HEAT repeat domain-containing protein [Planctomycetes bacterium]|nr:HEAT repeat domain-containing protein [Planctomycetota bacterium]